ncbi:MAG TPA: O-antigen ligase family protein [Bryobacteraceae bacterium]|nr:O-antigen ligase family protein [Bryobacteraceae bacterium]
MSRFKPRNSALADESGRANVHLRVPETELVLPGSALSRFKPGSLAAGPTEKLAFGLNMLFLFFVNSRIIELFPLNASLHLMVVLSIASGVVAIFNGMLWRTLASGLGTLYLCLTIWFGLTIPVSVWPGGAAGVFRSEWLTSLCTFFLVASIPINSQQVLKAMWVSACAFLAAGLLALTRGAVVDGRLFMASGGTFGNPNYLAAAMCTGVLLWWFILRIPRQRWFWRTVGIGAVAILIMVTVQTGSRGALCALLATAPFLVMQYSLASRLWIAIGFVTVLLLGFMAAPGLTVKRLTVFFEPDQSVASQAEYQFERSATQSAQSRLSLLKRSLEITGQYPILGAGIGMFAIAEDKLARAEGVPSMWHGTHNTYTQVSSETGIPGLILFLAILAANWRALSALRRDRRLKLHVDGPEIQTAATALWLILLDTMIYAVFAHFAYSYTIPIISGLVVALSRCASRELEQVSGR